jgi:cell division protease FtsH
MFVFQYFTQNDPKSPGEQVRTELLAAYNSATEGENHNELSTAEIESMARNGRMQQIYYLTDENTIYAFAFVAGTEETIPDTRSGEGTSEAAVVHRYLIALSSSAEAELVLDNLRNTGVRVQTVVIHPEEPGFPIWLMVIMGIFFFFIIMQLIAVRRQQQGGGGAVPFGKSKATMINPDDITVSMDDVAGCDEAKEEAQEPISFLQDPSAYHANGAKMPTGILMVGPPGTGKTMLSKAMAKAAGVPFLSMSGSDFVEMFVGVGAARVRDTFEQAKKHAPSIIFIDEIDAVGRHRGAGVGGGNDEREQTLNALLVAMDGFEENTGVIVIAATNRPDVLDPALLRPGRFDRQITVGLPDVRGREQILKVHMQKIRIQEGCSADEIAAQIAQGTAGFSGADLANLTNEAALHATRNGQEGSNIHDFEKAKDKVIMGPERKSITMPYEEKKVTAYHEAGHAIVGGELYLATKAINEKRKQDNKGLPRREQAPMLQAHDPVTKVSIMPRGRALGVTMFTPEEDRYSHSKRLLNDMMASLYGGRIAEDLIFGDECVTTGASNDIERVTAIANKMVKQWGLVLGDVHNGDGDRKTAPRLYEKDDSANPFLGKTAAQPEHVSGETVHNLDKRIENTLYSAYKVAYDILKANRNKMDVMADALMKYETIDKEMVDEIMAGKSFEQLSTPEWWSDEDEAAYQKIQQSNEPSATAEETDTGKED